MTHVVRRPTRLARAEEQGARDDAERLHRDANQADGSTDRREMGRGGLPYWGNVHLWIYGKWDVAACHIWETPIYANWTWRRAIYGKLPYMANWTWRLAIYGKLSYMENGTWWLAKLGNGTWRLARRRRIDMQSIRRGSWLALRCGTSSDRSGLPSSCRLAMYDFALWSVGDSVSILITVNCMPIRV